MRSSGIAFRVIRHLSVERSNSKVFEKMDRTFRLNCHWHPGPPPMGHFLPASFETSLRGDEPEMNSCRPVWTAARLEVEGTPDHTVVSYNPYLSALPLIIWPDRAACAVAR